MMEIIALSNGEDPKNRSPTYLDSAVDHRCALKRVRGKKSLVFSAHMYLGSAAGFE